MNIAFCTYVSDRYYHSMGCDKLVRSAKYFHPNIPMIVYGDEDIAKHKVPFGLLHPFIIWQALLKYDAVVYFDADSMITGPLYELLLGLEQDYTVIGVRNNNDFGKAGKDEPITQPGIGIEDYLNAGLIAVNDATKFLLEWQEANMLYGGLLPFKEQSVYNALCRKYKTLMIDPPESGVYYGVSGVYGTETHWDSWMDIKPEGGDLMLNGKKVKVLHHAGGGGNVNKLGFYMFNDETRKRLIEITGL